METIEYALTLAMASVGVLALAAAGICTVSFIKEATNWWKYRR